MVSEEKIKGVVKKWENKIFDSEFSEHIRDSRKCSEFAKTFKSYGAFLTIIAFFLAISGFLFSINRKSQFMPEDPVVNGFLSLSIRVMEFSSLVILFFLIALLLRILILEAHKKQNYYFSIFGLLLLVFTTAFTGYILLANINLIGQLIFFVIGIVGLILFLWLETIYKKKIITKIKQEFLQKVIKIFSGMILLVLLWPLLVYTNSVPAFQEMGTITNMGIIFFFLMIALGLVIVGLDLIFELKYIFTK